MALKKLILLFAITTVLFSCETESFKDDILVEEENPIEDNNTGDNEKPPITENGTNVIDMYNDPNNGL
ncbi:hypothetical protein [Aquimarina muelleri]|uniref:Uncharacterized protein n=1 Tax=Aquimarina muelleri TaxID=279356 RepID=A0A918N4P8_9FLAO|nr:hypothetical protein [Aquimarina muelleri]MCX2763795.1 hypothetical protein [Aquimarina muelleri]GGX31134.1 hypothetical protein GCM10007384_35230 [Aquimarina muelleri]